MRRHAQSRAQLSLSLPPARTAEPAVVPQEAVETLAAMLLEVLGGGAAAEVREAGDDVQDHR